MADPQFNSTSYNANGYPMVMPVKLKLEGQEFWTLPIEPLVSISGGNVIAKRNVAKGKGRGTIKERWSRDDYAVNIEGMLINFDDPNAYPEDDVRKLREFCEAKEAIQIECDLLGYFDVNRIVIEKFEIPFTKGENNQKYSISAYSDDIVDLLVEDTNPMAPTTPASASFENV